MRNPEKTNRLYWKCRRGMLELDLYLQNYLARRYPDAPVEEQVAFDVLLDEQDQDLYAWLTNQAQPHDEKFYEIVAIIQTVCRGQ